MQMEILNKQSDIVGWSSEWGLDGGNNLVRHCSKFMTLDETVKEMDIDSKRKERWKTKNALGDFND